MNKTKSEKFIIFTAICFIVSGFILIFADKKLFPDFYNPIFMGFISFVSTLLIFLPNLAFKPADNETKNILLKFQLLITFFLILNGIGALGLYKIIYFKGFQFDKLVHFSSSFIFIIIITKFLQVWYKMSLRDSLLIGFILVLMAGFFWESLEMFSDKFFGTKTFGFYRNHIFEDTLFDIIFNILGIITGILSLKSVIKIKSKISRGPEESSQRQ